MKISNIVRIQIVRSAHLLISVSELMSGNQGPVKLTKPHSWWGMEIWMPMMTTMFMEVAWEMVWMVNRVMETRNCINPVNMKVLFPT